MNIKSRYLLLTVVCLLTFVFAGTVVAQTLPAPQTQIISGDKLVIGENYTLKNGQTLNGDLVIVGSNGLVEAGALVNGNISLIGGNLDLAGEVDGSFAIIGGNLTLRSGSVVRGDINTVGGNLEGEELATITGQVRRMTPRALFFNLDREVQAIPRRGLLTTMGDFIGSTLSRVLRVLGMAVLALLLGLLIPKPLKRVSASFTAQPWLSLGVGLLSLIILPILLLLLSITLILIPVTLLAFFVLAVAVIFGWLAAGYWIGERLATLFKTIWAEAVSAGLGTLVLGIAVWLIVFIPCLGWLAVPLVASLGLGGVILSRFGTEIYAERYPVDRSGRTVTAPPVPTAAAEGGGAPENQVKSETEDRSEKPEGESS